jgi:hypothetical protein
MQRTIVCTSIKDIHLIHNICIYIRAKITRESLLVESQNAHIGANILHRKDMCVVSCCNSVENTSSYGSTVTEGRSVTVLCNNVLPELRKDPDPAMYLLNHLHAVVEP